MDDHAALDGFSYFVAYALNVEGPQQFHRSIIV